MKTIICGTRRLKSIEHVAEAVRRAKSEMGITISEVVCGMAPGADLLGFELARKWNIPIMEFPADWIRIGKRAGPIRNDLMANYAEACIAIRLIEPHEDPCTVNIGTNDMVRKALAKGLPTFVLDVSEP